MIEILSRPARLLLGTTFFALVATTAGCGGASKTTSTTRSTSAPAVSATSPSTSASSASTAAAAAGATTTAAAAGASTGGLSGTWSGHYSGSFTGTFSLTWQQSGSNLTGTIEISSFNNQPTSINGSRQGDQISFGTVGSQAITYSGSVSGASMSGSWQLKAGGGTQASGSWNATKSS